MVLVNRNHNLNKLKIGDILTDKEKVKQLEDVMGVTKIKQLESEIERLEQRVKDLTLAIQLMAKSD